MIVTIGLPYVVRPQLRVIMLQNGQPFMGDDGKPVPSYFSHDRQITERLFSGAIQARYGQDGAKDKSVRKMNGRVKKAIDRAVMEKQDEIELDRTQVEHLLSCMEAWELKGPGEASDYASYWLDFTEHLEEVLREKGEAPSNGTAAIEKRTKVKA